MAELICWMEPRTESNCYLLGEEGMAVVVDSNDPAGPQGLLEERGWTPELIPLTHEHCDYMAGAPTALRAAARPSPTPWVPFDPRAVAFLSDLSADLLHIPEARAQDAAAAFGFWCRPAHLQVLARRHASPTPRLGRGLVFHVAPSNVPALFGYTMAIGLLAGNANVMRASSRRGEADAVLLARLTQVLDRPEHSQVRERLSIVTYGRDDGVTAAYCARCDGRVVWGGDATVAALRAVPMPPHAVELSFPDRWSLALFSQTAFSAMDGEELAVQARRFYNDTYFPERRSQLGGAAPPAAPQGPDPGLRRDRTGGAGPVSGGARGVDRVVRLARPWRWTPYGTERT